MIQGTATYQLSFILPQKILCFLEDSFAQDNVATGMSLIECGKNKGLWKLDFYFENRPTKDEIQKKIDNICQKNKIASLIWTVKQVLEKNWLKENLKSFKPISIGRFYIYGSHIKAAIPKDKIALRIDASTAFGSGKHATTKGCLKMLESIVLGDPLRTVLDMGCGSGILSMATVKALNGLVQVDAVDIDPESVRVAIQNTIDNKVSKQINVFESVGYQRVVNSYDLIFENILANPLIGMADDLYQHLNYGGMAVLSGFLTDQKSLVLNAHKKAGLSFVDYRKIKEWGTLLVKKN